MRFLALNSLALLLLLLSSCSPGILSGYKKAGTVTASKSDLYPFFQEEDSTRRFNMQIDFRKNHFSGMLIVKQTGKDTYRTVLSTYFGMSVFDFEFSNTDFKVNQCIDALNKGKIINALRNDFQYLFFSPVPEQFDAEIYRNTKGDSTAIYKVKTFSDKTGYYLVNNESKELRRLDFPHFISTLRYDFENYNQRFPSSIRIKHSRVGFQMQLESLD